MGRDTAMEIASSRLALQSSYASQSRELNLSVTRLSASRPSPAQDSGETGDTVQLSDEAQSMEADDQLQLSVMRLVLERMAGHRFDVFDPSELTGDTEKLRIERPDSDDIRWSVETTDIHWRRETEDSQFRAEGIIRTRDGEEIRLDVKLRMSREFEELSVNGFQADNGAVKDPLILNFDGTAAELGNEPVSMDLTLDGNKEAVPMPTAGSGFLVRMSADDENTVNGSQLFGPATGHGYAELADHDDDGNGWIDSGDAIFDSLGIWRQSPDGELTVTPLEEMDVGALSLDAITTPFTHTDGDGQSRGQTRSTGVFLYENGGAGTMQQVDLGVA